MEPKQVKVALATASNYEFASALRECVSAYFASITEWESRFHKFNRLSGAHYRVPADLTGAQNAYARARAELEPLVPRARLLCRRYEINDPWPWVLRIQLGTEAGPKSALSPNERALILHCLRELEFRAADDELSPPQEKRREPSANQDRGALRRILDFFT